MLILRPPHGEHLVPFLGQTSLLITPGRAGKAFPVGAGLDKPQARQAVGGFRGAALNQSRSASGVYTGLVCYDGVGVQESASCGKGKMQLRGVSAKCSRQ